jgi:hypothetical protein
LIDRSNDRLELILLQKAFQYSQLDDTCMHSSTPPSCARAALLLCSRSLRFHFLRSPLDRLSDLALASRGELVLGRLLARGCVPVDDHLQSEDDVQHQAGEEAVEDDGVVDFGESGEDSGERTEEVGEDLFVDD